MTTNNDAFPPFSPEFRAAYEEMLANADRLLKEPGMFFYAVAPFTGGGSYTTTFQRNGQMVVVASPPCKHRWVTEVDQINCMNPVHDEYFLQHVNSDETVNAKYVFCATCGVTADDAAVRTAASGD